MINFDITHRFTGAVQFTAEIDCAEDAPRSVKLGLAVQWGLKTRANFAGANLADANFAGANLAGANLAGANLARANFAGAYLAGANLARANFARANFAGANLADANFAGAYLADANFARANLADANLADAYLADANLADANLAGAYLAGAKWRYDITITQAPIQIYGLYWPVTILDEHMQIGCELHRLCEWDAFDDDRIGRMDARHAKKFWTAQKDALLLLARGAGRSF